MDFVTKKPARLRWKGGKKLPSLAGVPRLVHRAKKEGGELGGKEKKDATRLQPKVEERASLAQKEGKISITRRTGKKKRP